MSKARDLAGLFNLGPRSGTTAQRPATADVGDIYYNGTTGKTEIYTTTGWKEMASGIPFGNTAGRPTSPAVGQPYFNGEQQRLELYASTGWQNIVSETPGVVSISGNYLESTGSATITITGTNFTTGAIASAIGTNGVEVNASSTIVNSIVSVTAVFSGLSNANEPYDIKVTNTSNLFGLLPDALYINASPVWQTASGSLGTFNEQVSISLSATATDSDSTISYALASGSTLPTGITLNSATGLISGTLPNISTTTTYTFTINASDGLNTIPRSFSFISTADLYEFTSFTFTNAGVTGSSGPTLSQVRSAYSSAPWASTYLNMTSQGIQKWTVPVTANYRITASGAGGGGTTSGVGSGALIQDTFALTAGEVIDIVVGQTGGATAGATGGGGGSYVVRTPYNTNQSILVIAGGGGGTEGSSSLQQTSNGQSSTSGADGSSPNATNGGGFGGTSGNGGGAASSDNSGGGGAGFFTNGTRNNGWNNNGGTAFVNGALGASATAPACFGGFGGGSAASGNGNGGGAGAGGGYSGGGGGDNAGGTVGGGGGSYFANGLNINRVVTAGGGSSGNTAGYVTILKV